MYLYMYMYMQYSRMDVAIIINDELKPPSNIRPKKHS